MSAYIKNPKQFILKYQDLRLTGLRPWLIQDWSLAIGYSICSPRGFARLCGLPRHPSIPQGPGHSAAGERPGTGPTGRVGCNHAVPQPKACAKFAQGPRSGRVLKIHYKKTLRVKFGNFSKNNGDIPPSFVKLRHPPAKKVSRAD